MGIAVKASKKGLNFEELWERNQAKGSAMQKSIIVVRAASLKESIKGVKLKFCKTSII